MTTPAAADVLNGAHLVFAKQSTARQPSTVPTAIVVQQVPAAGTRVAEGSHVDLVVRGSTIPNGWRPYIATAVVTSMVSQSTCYLAEPGISSGLRVLAAAEVDGPRIPGVRASYRWTLCFVTRRNPAPGHPGVIPVLGEKIQLYVSEPSRDIRALYSLYRSTSLWLVEGILGPVPYVMTPR